jgi:hypothetical protein
MRRRTSIIRPVPSALLVVGKEPASISSSSNSNHPLANGQQSTSKFAKKASSLSNGNFQRSAAVRFEFHKRSQFFKEADREASNEII